MCSQSDLFEAVRSASRDTVLSLLEQNTNPYCQLWGQRPSEKVRDWLARSWRMGNPNPEKRKIVAIIHNYLLSAEKRWRSEFVLKRFLRRWCRWQRRTIKLKESVRARRVFCQLSQLYEEMGPPEIVKGMLHPGPLYGI